MCQPKKTVCTDGCDDEPQTICMRRPQPQARSCTFTRAALGAFQESKCLQDWVSQWSPCHFFLIRYDLFNSDEDEPPRLSVCVRSDWKLAVVIA